MNRCSSLIVCLIIVAAVFLEVGCVPPGPPPPPPPPPPELPSVYCSHRVGAIVNPGDSIRYKRTAADMSVEFTLTLEESGFVYDGTSTGVTGSISATSEKYQYCWGKECFIAEKNSDGSWTIKSLPFMD